MKKMITVARMPQTIQYDGHTYGPSDKPLRVPEELAAALGLTPVGGAQVSAPVPDDAQAEELRAARTLAEQAQGNLNRLLEQLAPLANEGEMPDQVLARVIGDRQALNARAQTHAEALQDLTRASDAAKDEARRLGIKLEQTEQDAAGKDEQLRAAQDRVAELEAQPLLPPDALKRITDVKGVGDKLAPTILDALTAPAAKE